MLARGVPSNQVVELVDLFPTLVDLANPLGVPADNTSLAPVTERMKPWWHLPGPLDGQSLAPIVLGDPSTAKKESELCSLVLSAAWPSSQGSQTRVPGCKHVAISQYMPKVAFQECMAYSFIGKSTATMMWSRHLKMDKLYLSESIAGGASRQNSTSRLRSAKCSVEMEASVEKHVIPRTGPVPCSLEQSENLLRRELLGEGLSKLPPGSVRRVAQNVQRWALGGAAAVNAATANEGNRQSQSPLRLVRSLEDQKELVEAIEDAWCAQFPSLALWL